MPNKIVYTHCTTPNRIKTNVLRKYWLYRFGKSFDMKIKRYIWGTIISYPISRSMSCRHTAKRTPKMMTAFFVNVFFLLSPFNPTLTKEITSKRAARSFRIGHAKTNDDVDRMCIPCVHIFDAKQWNRTALRVWPFKYFCNSWRRLGRAISFTRTGRAASTP